MVTEVAQQRGPIPWQELLQTTSGPVSELVVSCPKCKTFETITFTLEGTLRTRKFSQEDRYIYHDCGSTEPCRLYRAL